jgi:hypothetical protein
MKILLGDSDAHPDGKTHNKTDHVSMDKRWHSSILNIFVFSVELSVKLTKRQWYLIQIM